MKKRIRGLTFQRPWEHAIFDLDKDVENRTWQPPASMIEQYLAIHAGQTYDKAGAGWIKDKFVTSPIHLPKRGPKPPQQMNGATK